MKTIGLIGGVSWVSTQEYYRRLNVMAHERHGGMTSAKVLLSSVNFEDILPFQESGDEEGERELLLRHALTLEKAGADVVLICSNTTNKTADDLGQRLKVPVVNIVEAIAARIVALGYRRVGLLGTKHVMYGDFFTAILRKHGIEVVVPPQDEGGRINEIIYQELVQNRFVEESSRFIRSAIANLAGHEVEAVILGCTELPLAVRGEAEGGLPLIDSIQVHLDAVSDYL